MALPGENDIMQQLARQNQQLMEHNARLMDMLERFGIREDSSSNIHSRNPEFIIESLSSNIKKFEYDPDNGEVFDQWYRQYEDVFLKDGAKLDDAAKIRLLLRSLSVNTYNQYLNLSFPKNPHDFSFEETVNKLKDQFSTHKSLFNKRYECFQLVKNEADDFVRFAGIVNKHCEEFQFGNFTADQFKSLIFISGLRSAKDAYIRTRLVSKLETNADDWSKFETLIEECQRLKNLYRDSAMMELKQIEQKNPTSTSVNAKSKPSGNGFKKTQKTPCWQCGGVHFVHECGFTNHTCRVCKKIGHKEGYCGCYTGSKENTIINIVCSVNQVSSQSKRKYVTVSIDGNEISLQFSTASDITIISEKNFIEKFGLYTLYRTTRSATTADGAPLELILEGQGTVKFGSLTKTGKFYVAKHNLNLFGLEWIELFDLWNVSLSTICNQVPSKPA